MKTSVIEYKFNTLPDDFKKEVLNFIDFLLTKRKKGRLDNSILAGKAD